MPSPDQPYDTDYEYHLRPSTAAVTVRLAGAQVAIGLAGMALAVPVSLMAGLAEPTSVAALGLQLVLASLVVLDLGAAALIVGRWARRSYTLRPGAVEVRNGFLQPRVQVYETKEVEAPEVRQSLWGRLFQYGNVRFYSPRLHETVVLEDAPNPHHYAAVVRWGQTHALQQEPAGPVPADGRKAAGRRLPSGPPR